MAEAKVKTAFDKLNGRNYVPWSYRMKLFLKNEKCWDVIEQAERPNNITATKWTKMQESASYFIGVNVDDGQLPFIKRAESAKGAWDALSKHHKNSSFSGKMRLLRKLFREVLPKNGDMELHLSKLMEYYDQLCEIGHDLDDELFVSIMITSVGDDYDNLITALDCRDEKDLTLDFVKIKLLDEYDRKKKEEQSNGVAMKVFSKSVPTCHFCEKKGHVKKFCTKYTEWLEVEKQKNEKMEKERNEKFKRRGQFERTKYAANKVDHADEDNDEEHANYAFCVRKSKAKLNGWYIDSGASCHITNDRDFFIWLDDSVRQSVTVANGEVVWSSGKGNGKIVAMSASGDEHEIVVHDVLYVPEVNANLLSVKKLTSKGYDLNFSTDECVIKYEEKIVIVAKLQNGLYKINESQCCSLFPSVAKCVHYWHEVFGHRSIDAIKKMFKEGLTEYIQITNCNCIIINSSVDSISKQHRLTHLINPSSKLN